MVNFKASIFKWSLICGGGVPEHNSYDLYSNCLPYDDWFHSFPNRYIFKTQGDRYAHSPELQAKAKAVLFYLMAKGSEIEL